MSPSTFFRRLHLKMEAITNAIKLYTLMKNSYNRFLFTSILTLAFAITTLFPFHQLQAQCNGVSESDSLELVKFYKALGGDNWTNNDGWLVEPVSEWFGVTLSEDGCNIQILDLTYNGLEGSLFDLNLPKLNLLSLSQNNIDGNILDFSKLSSLIRLDLAQNQLAGSIPDFFNLPKLKELVLSNNQLTGAIPDFFNLKNLDRLYLSNNQLTGSIPDFSNLSLSILSLYGNQLTGKIPDFSKLGNLSYLWLDQNSLTGSIPNFSNSKNLIQLYLSYNNLTGNVPNFSNLKRLDILFLDNNNLTGIIPNFNNLPQLRTLKLDNNNLTGTIPNFNNLPQLKTLKLDNNNLTGTIPNFNNLPQLKTLKLDNNNLTGTIPNFNNLPQLKTLKLDNNNLTGIISNFNNLPDLINLGLGQNQLTGYIPNFSNLPILETLSVCPNNLIAPIPKFDNCPLLNLESTDFSCIQTPTVTGTAYHDLNQNCLQDEGEQPLKNTKITANDHQFTTFTDENGFYSLPLDTGTYQITATPPNFLWNSESCPESYTLTFENYTDTISYQNFGFTIADECTFLTIDVASPLQRRCFQNSYKVSYCNEGTRTAENPYIELTFPDEIIPLDASIPYSQDGNVLSFDLEALAIGECGSFVVRDSVSCEAVLGSAACVEGRIYPAFLCRDIDSLWDGSDIVVEGECIESEYIQFTLTNRGEDMQDSVEYRIYENDVLTTQHHLQLMAGESTELNIAATGATYRLKAAQTEFHPSESEPQVVVELCGDAPYGLGFVTSQPNSDLEHFIDIDCQEIIGSFDPNDKQVHPTGIAEQHYIAEGTELTYKIRFQNTGNDTAFRVTIIDTLQSEFLDLRSFKILNASHAYDARIQDQNVLIVEFNNILLPDSTTNELESQGFVQYRITPFQDAPKKSVITNLGDIYFDYNQSITTNTVFNTIGIPELDATLPIELLQFDAYLDENNYAQLTWMTASEINNSHFEVQRSSNGRDFAGIGKIAGKGTSSELHFYEFADRNLPSTTSIVYYRLKQIDFNGQSSFSKVIALPLQNEQTVRVRYDAVQNRMEVIAAEYLELQIFDALGRLMRSFEVMEGRQTFDLQGLESGVYVYQLEMGQKGKFLVGR